MNVSPAGETKFEIIFLRHNKLERKTFRANGIVIGYIASFKLLLPILKETTDVNQHSTGFGNPVVCIE